MSCNIIFKTPEREPSSYLVSAILNTVINNPEHFFEIEMQNNLFSRLSISRAEWMLSIENPDNASQLVTNLRTYLAELESVWNDDEFDEDYEDEFEILKNRDFFNSIEQIEQEATALLGEQFRLGIIFNYLQNDLGDIVKEDILDLYNFIIRSKILTREELLKLLYPLAYSTIPANNLILVTATGAYGMNMNFNAATIGMDVKYNWYEEVPIRDNFTKGLTSTNQHAHGFIHEFAHALSMFYNLSPNFKSVLNQQRLNMQANENISAKIKLHFLMQFGNNWSLIPDHFLVEKAVNYIITNTVSEEHRNDFPFIMLAYLVAVPSHYARIDLLSIGHNPNDNHVGSEWFAEAFAYYFLTPPNQRQAIWNMWHEFFTQHVNELQQT